MWEFEIHFLSYVRQLSFESLCPPCLPGYRFSVEATVLTNDSTGSSQRCTKASSYDRFIKKKFLQATNRIFKTKDSSFLLLLLLLLLLLCYLFHFSILKKLDYFLIWLSFLTHLCVCLGMLHEPQNVFISDCFTTNSIQIAVNYPKIEVTENDFLQYE